MGQQIDGMEIDHINNNGLDNRVDNLRVVTKRENSRNQSSRKVNANTTYAGVTWREHAHKWWARVRVDGKQVHLGYFNSAVDAAMAYDRANLYYFGDSDVLNFPDRKNEHDLSSPYTRIHEKVKSNNTTGYRGVSMKVGRYVASIGIGSREHPIRFNLGRFNTAEDAAKAYDRKYIELQGFDAERLNFPELTI